MISGPLHGPVAAMQSIVILKTLANLKKKKKKTYHLAPEP